MTCSGEEFLFLVRSRTVILARDAKQSLKVYLRPLGNTTVTQAIRTPRCCHTVTTTAAPTLGLDPDDTLLARWHRSALHGQAQGPAATGKNRPWSERTSEEHRSASLGLILFLQLSF